jgi:hypothetical protein
MNFIDLKMQFLLQRKRVFTLLNFYGLMVGTLWDMTRCSLIEEHTASIFRVKSNPSEQQNASRI